MESLRELFKIGHGPSSSHTMGPRRALQRFLCLFPHAENYEVRLYGSLALTGRGHLTDVALQQVFLENNVRGEIIFDYELSQLIHPNQLKISAFDNEGQLINETMYYSIGGGNLIENGINLNQIAEVYPFANFTEIKTFAKENNISYYQIVDQFDDEAINEYLANIFTNMVETINRGLMKEGTLPGSLMLKRKAADLFKFQDQNETLAEQAKRRLFAFAYATAEENAAGGLVVTAPTCGSAGILPAVLYNAQLVFGYSHQAIVDALKVAGLVGVTVKQNGSISGAECGCQAECGVACAMSAAALAHLQGLDLDQIEYAAEVALEHHLGLTCDPVQGYVQIPCIERNAVVAARVNDAVMIAKHLTMNRRVSLDDIILTMYETGRDLNPDYRETSRGGLAKNIR